MDTKTYATLVDLCDRLAGRLSDTVLDSVRVHYFVGEDVLAESSLLLGLAYENAGVTPGEHELLRSILDDPDNPDLADVPVITEVPRLRYRFTPTPPPGAPDPARADELLSGEAVRQGGRRLHRTWRTPLNDREPGTWLYVLEVAPGTDGLGAYSGITSQLGATLRLTWPVEVATEGKPPPPYQAAALTGAHQIWQT